MSDVKLFQFLGFHDHRIYYGEGEYVIGNVYKARNFSDYDNENSRPDALFTDEHGDDFWEDLIYFEEVK